jgi:phage terminase large subunit-like protein
MAQAVCGWFFTEMSRIRKKPVTVIYAAHTMKVAISIFEDMGEMLKEHYGATFRRGNGREEISLTTPYGRCKWYLVANKENAPRGFTADLIWIDEMQAFKAQTISSGFQPTMAARNPTTANGYPMMILTATAGDARSDFQLNYREQAFQSIESGEFSRSFMAEWSAPENLDWRLPTTWAWACPGLGQSVYMTNLENYFKTMKRDQFIQEFLNIIKLTVNAWVQPEEWDRMKTEAAPSGKMYLAVESSTDDSRYVGVLAGEANGKTHVQQAFLVWDEASMWEKIIEIMKNPMVSLLITPALHLHTPTNLLERSKTVGYAEILTYTGLVLKMIKEKQLTHDGSQVLRDHVLHAALVKTMNGVVISSQKSAGPIEMARCCVWAASIASKPQRISRPSMGRSA